MILHNRNLSPRNFKDVFFGLPVGNFYTWLNIFTQPAAVMVVTNMRCATDEQKYYAHVSSECFKNQTYKVNSFASKVVLFAEVTNLYIKQPLPQGLRSNNKFVQNLVLP